MGDKQHDVHAPQWWSDRPVRLATRGSRVVGRVRGVRTLWVGLDVLAEVRAGGHHTVVVDPLQDQKQDLVDPRRLTSQPNQPPKWGGKSWPCGSGVERTCARARPRGTALFLRAWSSTGREKKKGEKSDGFGQAKKASQLAFW